MLEFAINLYLNQFTPNVAVIANLMLILIFSTGANQTSQPESPVAKPVAFDIVLGQNDSEKPSPLMPNRPPRRLKVGFPLFASVLFVRF